MKDLIKNVVLVLEGLRSGDDWLFHVAGGRFSLGGHGDRDRLNKLEKWLPAIIPCCRLSARTPALITNAPPLNRQTLFNLLNCVYFLYAVFILLLILSSDCKAHMDEVNHASGPSLCLSAAQAWTFLKVIFFKGTTEIS